MKEAYKEEGVVYHVAVSPFAIAAFIRALRNNAGIIGSIHVTMQDNNLVVSYRYDPFHQESKGGDCVAASAG